MSSIKVLTVLLGGTALLLAAGTISNPPLETRNNPWFHVNISGPPDTETGETGTVQTLPTGETDFSQVSGTPGPRRQDDIPLTSVRPFLDWGNDYLVATLNSAPTLGGIATDVAPNGDIWLGVLDPNTGATNDTIFFYSSTDGGQNWTYRNLIGGPSGDIRDFDLKVGSDGGGTWLYAFVVYDGVGGIYLRRQRPDGSNNSWTQIQPGDTFASVSADRNIESPEHLFCGFGTAGGRIGLMSSSDHGTTWGNQRGVSSLSMRPAVCAGGDGYVYIAFGTTDSAWIWTGRYTNNLISPTWVFGKLDSSSDRAVWDASIAAHREGAGATQTAIALYSHRNTNGNVPPHYGMSTNGGVSWTTSHWPPTNQARTTWDARHPYIRSSYEDPAELFRGIVTMNEPSESWDTLVYAYSRPASPDTWVDRATHNEHRATGEFGARVDRSSQTQGAYIAYREYAANDVWFDGFNPTGVGEGTRPGAPSAPRIEMPTLLSGDASLNLMLPRSGRVEATLYDGTGRVVRRLFDGTLEGGHHQLPVGAAGLNEGIYFLHLSLDGEKQTTKLVRLR